MEKALDCYLVVWMQCYYDFTLSRCCCLHAVLNWLHFVGDNKDVHWLPKGLFSDLNIEVCYVFVGRGIKVIGLEVFLWKFKGKGGRSFVMECAAAGIRVCSVVLGGEGALWAEFAAGYRWWKVNKDEGLTRDRSSRRMWDGYVVWKLFMSWLGSNFSPKNRTPLNSANNIFILL